MVAGNRTRARFPFHSPFVNPRARRYGPARLMKIHPLITKTDDLARRWSSGSRSQPFIAVDTEFMRENTYWPDLCLIQVASTDEAAAIDPKARHRPEAAARPDGRESTRC